MLLSIIVNNYNYSGFLRQCLDSIIGQVGSGIELIVVDDGSTDNSVALISETYPATRLIAKPNGGQASAFNAGFAASKGEWIWFIDSDDFIRKDAVEKLLLQLDHTFCKLHFPLLIVDANGRESGDLNPVNPLSGGNVVSQIMEHGDYSWPPTTGNVFSRKMMNACMPIPEEEYRLSADFFLCSFAGVYGSIKKIDDALGFYRVHSDNGHFGFSFNPAGLKKKGQILLTSIERIRSLMQEFHPKKSFEYPFSRAVLESLTIARRFGALDLPPELVGSAIQKKWYNSAQFVSTRGMARIKAIVFWTAINFAPLKLARLLITKGIEKNRRK